MRLGIGLCLSSALLLIAGCGGGGKGGYSTAAVSGVVKMDGKPLANARVVFQPDVDDGGANLNAPAAMGTTNASGEYTLEIPTTGQQGAVVGAHVVRITMGGSFDDEDTDELPEDDSAFMDSIPPKYNEESDLRFTVTKEGSDSANFELKSDAGGGSSRDDDDDGCS